MPELLTGNNFPFVQDFSRQPHNSCTYLMRKHLGSAFETQSEKLVDCAYT